MTMESQTFFSVLKFNTKVIKIKNLTWLGAYRAPLKCLLLPYYKLFIRENIEEYKENATHNFTI